ncbi:MAG TPA: hypothetical protein VIK54_15960, partial [Acidimicrobiia bacterium]
SRFAPCGTESEMIWVAGVTLGTVEVDAPFGEIDADGLALPLPAQPAIATAQTAIRHRDEIPRSMRISRD